MSPMNDNEAKQAAEPNRPVIARRLTLEDRVLKFIEGNNRSIWIGILMICAVTVLLTNRD